MRTRPRWLVAVIVVITAIAVTAGSAIAHSWAPWWTTTEERELIDWLNGQRSWYGHAPLPVDSDLTVSARNQAARMAQAGRIYHQDLSHHLRAGWRRAGENVGVGSDTWQVHVALSYSPPHLTNMNGRWKAMGVGTARSGGRLYVAQVFGDF